MNPPPLPQQPPKLPRRWGSYKYLWLTLAVMILLGIAAVLFNWHGQTQKAEREWTKKLAERFGLSEKWAQRTVGGLTLETPCTLKPQGRYRSDEEASEDDYLHEVYQGVAPTSGLTVLVVHTRDEPLAEGELEKKARDAMDSTVKSLGGETGKYLITSTKVSGQEALHAVHEGKLLQQVPGWVPGFTMRVEGIFMTRGSDVWQVQIYTNAEDAKDIAARVIGSIRIKGR